jgi:hypothetical protein
MTVIDIIQSLELGRKSAHVVIQYEDGRTGEIGVHKGETTSCTAGGRNGESAFYWLARSGPGVFRIEYRASTLPKNLNSPNTFLILEALRRLDEEGAADDAAIPPMTQPPPTPDLLDAPPLADPNRGRPTIVQLEPQNRAPNPAPAPMPSPPRSASQTRPVPRSASAPQARAPSEAARPPQVQMRKIPVAGQSWSSNSPPPPPPPDGPEEVTQTGLNVAPPRKDSNAGWWDATVFPDGQPAAAPRRPPAPPDQPPPSEAAAAA